MKKIIFILASLILTSCYSPEDIKEDLRLEWYKDSCTTAILEEYDRKVDSIVLRMDSANSVEDLIASSDSIKRLNAKAFRDLYEISKTQKENVTSPYPKFKTIEQDKWDVINYGWVLVHTGNNRWDVYKKASKEVPEV